MGFMVQYRYYLDLSTGSTLQSSPEHGLFLFLVPGFTTRKNIYIGLIHVFEVVNIRRGPKNGLTPECDRENAN